MNHAAFPAAQRRRRVSPQAGRALEILGHAIDYLIDEHLGGVYVAGQLSSDPVLEAVQMLIELNRDVYFSCPVIPSWSERFQTWLNQLAPNSKKQKAPEPVPMRIRDVSPEKSRALEILGHAIDYLSDECLKEGKTLIGDDPKVEAIKLLIEINRQIYFSSPLVQTRRERVMEWLRFRGRRKKLLE